MRRISKPQSEIRHLQEKLAERNKTIADFNRKQSEAHAAHLKEVEGLRKLILEAQQGELPCVSA